jgi:chromosome transmission fidelity protein 1
VTGSGGGPGDGFPGTGPSGGTGGEDADLSTGGGGPESDTQTGAVMFCVCGGKLSEGINFKDSLGRLVVMVGLPYANPEEPELRARMKYLDDVAVAPGGEGDRTGSGSGSDDRLEPSGTNRALSRALSGGRGRRYYEALCMRSVNQSVGRAIRHVGDFAAIVFADKRYVSQGQTGDPPGSALRGVPAQLAGWIGERLVTPDGYGQAQAALAKFFAGKRERA